MIRGVYRFRTGCMFSFAKTVVRRPVLVALRDCMVYRAVGCGLPKTHLVSLSRANYHHTNTVGYRVSWAVSETVYAVHPMRLGSGYEWC